MLQWGTGRPVGPRVSLLIFWALRQSYALARRSRLLLLLLMLALLSVANAICCWWNANLPLTLFY